MKLHGYSFCFLIIFSLLATINTYSANQNISYTFPVYAIQPPAGSPAETTSRKQLTFVQNYPILFIGDSRTVGMQQALQYAHYDTSNQQFLAKVGKGYSWLTSQTNTFHSFTDTPKILIINLGINDLGNCKKYLNYYEQCMTTYWNSCPIYIVSVNPVCNPCKSVSNQQITAFNEATKQWIEEKNAQATTQTFSLHYIDTYSFLQKEGMSSKDGLHYSSDTYQELYNYILEHIEEPIGDGTGYYETTLVPPVGTEGSRFV